MGASPRSRSGLRRSTDLASPHRVDGQGLMARMAQDHRRLDLGNRGRNPCALVLTTA